MTFYKNLVYSGANGRKSPYDLHLAHAKAETIVIFAHGYKGFKDWGPWPLLGPLFSEAGFDFLKFNFSHNGGTVYNPIDFPDLLAFSENNYSMEQEDLRAITDLVHSGINLPGGTRDWNKIALIGHSRGGGSSILHAANDDRISQLTTWASVSDFGTRFHHDLEKWKSDGVAGVWNSRTKQEMPHKYQFYQDYKRHSLELDIAAAAKRIQKPWLILHGSEDETVDIEDAKLLKAWAPNAHLKLIEGAGHTFGGSHPWRKNSMPRYLKQVTTHTAVFFQKSL